MGHRLVLILTVMLIFKLVENTTLCLIPILVLALGFCLMNYQL